jgi:hypothetical protein
VEPSVIHSINSLARKRAAIVQPNKPAKACIDVEQAIRERLPILPTKASGKHPAQCFFQRGKKSTTG